MLLGLLDPDPDPPVGGGSGSGSCSGSGTGSLYHHAAILKVSDENGGVRIRDLYRGPGLDPNPDP
jgi:hypothetical protein